MRRLLYILAAAVCILAQRDVIYTVSGEEITGRILTITEDTVTYQVAEKSLSISRDSVLSIDLERIRPGHDWKTTKDIDDAQLKAALKQKTDEYEDEGFVVIYHTVNVQKTDKLIITRRLIGKIIQPNGRPMSRQAFDYLVDADFDLLWFRSISPEGLVFHLDDAALELGFPYGDLPDYNRLRRLKAAIGEATEESIIDFQTVEKWPLTPVLAVPSRIELPSPWPIIHAEIEIDDDIPCAVNGDEEFFRRRHESGKQVFTTDNIPALRREKQMPPNYTLRPGIIFNPFGIDIAEQMKSLPFNIELPELRFQNIEDGFAWLMDHIEMKGPDIGGNGFHVNPDVLSQGFGNDLERTLIIQDIVNNSELYLSSSSLETNPEILLENPDALSSSFFTIPLIEHSGLFYHIGDRFSSISAMPDDVSGAAAINLSTMELEILPDFCDSSEINLTGTLSPQGMLRGRINLMERGNQAGELLDTKGMSQREIMLFVFDMLTSYYPLAELDSFNIELDNPEMANMDIHFHRDFGHQKGMIILPLPVDGAQVPQMERDNPLYIDRTTFSATGLNITLPEGFTLVELPENNSVQGDNFSHSSIYNLNDMTFSVTSRSLLTRGFIDDEIKYREMQLLRSREIRLVVKEK